MTHSFLDNTEFGKEFKAFRQTESIPNAIWQPCSQGDERVLIDVCLKRRQNGIFGVIRFIANPTSCRSRDIFQRLLSLFSLRRSYRRADFSDKHIPSNDIPASAAGPPPKIFISKIAFQGNFNKMAKSGLKSEKSAGATVTCAQHRQ